MQIVKQLDDLKYPITIQKVLNCVITRFRQNAVKSEGGDRLNDSEPERTPMFFDILHRRRFPQWFEYLI